MTRLTLLLFVLPFSLLGQSAKEIIEKAEEKHRGNTLKATMTIEIIRPRWSREMSMKTWAKGDDYSLILVTSPAKEKGIVYLKRNKEVWNWVPSIERTIKLPPSMMSQSWMGTDFTNDDLVRESSVISDYSHEIVKDSVLEGRETWQLKLTPKESAAVVWGKVLVWIDKKDFLQLRTEFYDEDGYLVNTMIASNIKEMGGRILPAKLELIPADKKGHKTVMTYQKMEFDEPIPDDFFTTQNMKRVN